MSRLRGATAALGAYVLKQAGQMELHLGVGMSSNRAPLEIRGDT
jgi:hypothetical protein